MQRALSASAREVELHVVPFKESLEIRRARAAGSVDVELLARAPRPDAQAREVLAEADEKTSGHPLIASGLRLAEAVVDCLDPQIDPSVARSRAAEALAARPAELGPYLRVLSREVERALKR